MVSDLHLPTCSRECPAVKLMASSMGVGSPLLVIPGWSAANAVLTNSAGDLCAPIVLEPSLAMCPKGGVLSNRALAGIEAWAGMVWMASNSLTMGSDFEACCTSVCCRICCSCNVCTAKTGVVQMVPKFCKHKANLVAMALHNAHG